MNHGIRPPKRIVVKKTMNKTVLFMISTAIYSSSEAPCGAYTVKISAKATEPLIVPAVEMIVISLAVKTHLDTALTAYPNTKIAASLEMIQIKS